MNGLETHEFFEVLIDGLRPFHPYFILVFNSKQGESEHDFRERTVRLRDMVIVSIMAVGGQLYNCDVRHENLTIQQATSTLKLEYRIQITTVGVSSLFECLKFAQQVHKACPPQVKDFLDMSVYTTGFMPPISSTIRSNYWMCVATYRYAERLFTSELKPLVTAPTTEATTGMSSSSVLQDFHLPYFVTIYIPDNYQILDDAKVDEEMDEENDDSIDIIGNAEDMMNNGKH